MKKLLILFLFLGLVFCSPVFATIDYYEDFEGETVDEDWPYKGEYPSVYPCDDPAIDTFYNAAYCPKPNCYDFIRDDYSDRTSPATGQYWSQYCGWTTEAAKLNSQRSSFIFSNATSWSPCNEMNYNDDTEYWIGISVFIPSDYYEEYYKNMIWQIIHADGDFIHTMYFGGNTTNGVGGSTPNELHWRGVVHYSGYDYWNTFRENWADDKGNWVDFVIHAVWYSTTNANATTEIYMDGVSVFSVSGVANIPQADGPIWNIQLYNTSSVGNDPTATWNRWFDENGDTTNTTWRQLHIDEVRFTENTIDTKGYCDVAPPIWPQTPTISYPGNGATGINTTVTVTYSGYADHRTDAQGCFAYDTTEIQIDEDGGDWSTLIHEGEIDAETSHEITGLNYSTTYQMRVRHQSLRSGTATDYDSTWSDTVDFTTKAGAASPPMTITNINSGGLTISNINSGNLSATPK